MTDLIGYLSQSFPQTEKISLRLNAEVVYLSIENAIPCGIIVNELITNAIKHAFPDSNTDSRISTFENMIDIQFGMMDQQFELVVADNGAGLPPDFDWQQTQSLGLQLIQIIASHQLHGTLKVDSQQGTHVRLTFPLKQRHPDYERQEHPDR